MNRITKRLAAPIGAALIIGTSGFAFMASNSVPVTRAGEGTADIRGYQVSEVTYAFGYAGGPGANRIDGVSFSLNAPASTVDAFIEGAGQNAQRIEFRQCSSSNGTRWTCTGVNQQPMQIVNAANLTVSAVQ